MRPKLIGIVGSNADFSFNRILLQYMKRHFAETVDIEIQEINGVPLFCENEMKTPPAIVNEMADKIEDADGVIIAAPEYDHAIPAALKSVIEWLSSARHPFNDQHVMIVGASYGIQGTVRSQMNLRQVLDSPGVNANVLPGNEFMLSNVKDKFNENGEITDEGTIKFLDSCMNNFLTYSKIGNGANAVLH